MVFFLQKLRLQNISVLDNTPGSTVDSRTVFVAKIVVLCFFCLLSISQRDVCVCVCVLSNDMVSQLARLLRVRIG